MSWRRYQSYWLDFWLPRTKLVAFRVVFFGLLGIDSFLQIQHAPRYGAGGFNVSHLPWLDGLLPAPTRPDFLVLFLTQAYLAFSMALGVGGRLTAGLLAALFGYGYFASQLNSYQHHYLIFLVLVVLAFVPWRRLQAAPGASRGGRRGDAPHAVTSWALRLLLVQVAIVYFWAAIAKLDGSWVDGSAMAVQIKETWARGGIESLGGFKVAAIGVLLGELFLAVALLWRRLWPAALVVGVGFHLGIELAGFRIGLFSYFMFAIYLLLVPDSWIGAAARRLQRATEPLGKGADRIGPGTAAAFAAGAVLATVALWLSLPFAEAGTIAAVVFVAGAGLTVIEVRRRRGRLSLVRGAGAHVVACLALVCLEAGTEQSFDYHKYWAGSSRRLGIEWEAPAAYEILSERYAHYGPGHYHLGRLQRRAGDAEAALESFERAQRHGPDDYRGFLEAALIHHNAGRGPEAIAAARQVVELGPKNPQHRRLAERLIEQWEQVQDR